LYTARSLISNIRTPAEPRTFEDDTFVAAALLLLPYVEAFYARRFENGEQTAATGRKGRQSEVRLNFLHDERLKALAHSRLGRQSDLSFLSDLDKWASDLLGRWAAGQTDFVRPATLPTREATRRRNGGS
jgi:hypothetical protein